MKPLVSPLGDSAVTLTFGNEISEELNRRVVAEALAISAARLSGIHDVVPSYSSLTIHYDPLRVAYADLLERIAGIRAGAETAETTAQSATHVIPVRYDGQDIEDVARRCNLQVKDVIAIHTSREYRVFVIGFVPGFAYLGILDERLVLPRRDAPRKRVPRGSVAIAEAQTGVYPSETPGGWHLIGTTDVGMFDTAREMPALLAPGDRVRFAEA